MNELPPQSAEIYRQWAALACRPLPLPPESAESWQRLWSQHVEGQSLAELNIYDLSLLCSWGWKLAVQEHDFDAAANRAGTWFRHPEQSQQYWSEWDQFHSWEGMALCLAGRELEAIPKFRAALERTEGGSLHAPFLVVAVDVLMFLHERGEDYIPSPELDRLLRDAIARFAPKVSQSTAELTLFDALETARRDLVESRARKRAP